MTKKRFITKQERRLTRRIKIVFFMISTLFAVFILAYTTLFLWNMPKIPGVTTAAIFTIIAVTEVIVLIYLPFIAAFFGIMSGRRKLIREATVFKGELDIDYYRDILQDVEPATISILMDLKIEDKKDIAATLLRLYNKKIVDFKDEKIHIVGGFEELHGGERQLCEMISSGKTSSIDIERWKTYRRQDAIAEGYVKEKIVGRTDCCLSGCLSVIVFAACFAALCFFMFRYDMSGLDVIIEKFSATEEILAEEILAEDMLRLISFAKFAALSFFLIDLMFAAPCYIAFKALSYHTRENYTLIRTEKGNEMSEKVAGLQKFIHEFSNLSEAKKEQVLLWDDFLVYAVVMEENEAIVKDIAKMFKIDLKRFLKI